MAITGTKSDDELLGTSGDDVIASGNGDDIVYGGEGDDKLLGGAGDDTLDGGSGMDTLYGGSGNNIFVFSSLMDSTLSSMDTIQDYNVGSDIIDLSALGIVSMDDLTLTEVNGYIVVSHNNSDFSFRVNTNNVSDLTTSSFIFSIPPSDIDLSNNTISENVDGGIVGTLSTVDADQDSGQLHDYSVSDSRFEVVNGELKLVDGVSLDYEAEQSITVDVTTTDSTGLSYTETFTIDVLDDESDNTPPATLVADNIVVLEEAGGSFTLDIFDSGNDPLTSFTIDVGPENGSVVNLGDGVIEYTANSGFIGVDSIQYTAVSSTGEVTTSTLYIGVGPGTSIILDSGGDFLDNIGGTTNQLIVGFNGQDLISAYDMVDSVISTDGGDDLVAVSSMTNSVIDLGDGNNTLYVINGDGAESSEIYSGSGDDSIFAAFSGGVNNSYIDTGAGNDSVEIARLFGGYSDNNTINMGAGDDVATLYFPPNSFFGSPAGFVTNSTFIFDQGSGNDMLNSFVPGQGNVMDVSDYGYTDVSELSITSNGINTTVNLSAYDSITLGGFTGSLTNTDFIFA